MSRQLDAWWLLATCGAVTANAGRFCTVVLDEAFIVRACPWRISMAIQF
ncbi:MAG: hypothetical protein AAFX06_20165 [Planctomycetota bacterium]